MTTVTLAERPGAAFFDTPQHAEPEETPETTTDRLLADFEPTQAAVIAESLARLVGSALVAPHGSLDLHEPAVLRDYAARVVPAIVHGC